ncbi:helix-turn-helix-domain containing protein type [Grosmannia clavigera kw1407]|uniref:Helix-turn-helix-domain containing protein type n=1 Tax=Grosmannia clavigera (strain kw1407 / UAMH 11150) TaxID=655863 RepID=F0XB81_GROCL|nr:helix-turn-helix-domain containing protein type [Grosmannia clavigera kw1407]EFX04981.1 helix-turn-helix-domain containing protein type [Grosmannia clavigera kw1407]
MSSITLYDVAVPTFTRGLKTLDHILTKAEEYAKEKGIDADAEFIQARLIEDQFPLLFQVQNSTRNVKTYVDHLTGNISEPFTNSEKTFAELHTRISATLELLKTVKPDVANARGGTNTADFTVGGKEIQLTITQAVIQQGIPNFIFHVTTAYSILRAKGVPVGKSDYISSFIFN